MPLTLKKTTAAAVPTAPAGKVTQFVDANGILQSKDETGAVTPVGSSAQVQSDWNATSGLGVILNKPTISGGVQADWNATSGAAAILNKPTIPSLPSLAAVATSGLYSDLTGKPTIPAAQVASDWNASSGVAAILNKPTIPTLPTLAAVATSGLYSDLTGKPSLATVATSGLYADLSGKPTIPAAQVQSDWTASSGAAAILNKPTIPAAQVASDWNASSGVTQIANKPTLAAVAVSGAWSDLTAKPVVMAASGSGHVGGFVPDPGSVAGSTKFLREDATWAVPPTGSTPTQTLRNIATRCRPPSGLITASPLCFSRTMHINRGDAQTAVQLVYANWGATYQGESINTQNLTISCAIEYPVGTYTQGTFNGSAYGVIAPGANGVSDFIPVGIPKGATFFVRTYQSSTGGTWNAVTTVINRTVAAVGVVGGMPTIETTAFNTVTSGTFADATFLALSGGTAVNGFGPAGTNGNGYFPVAILGMSSVPAVLVLGDSRNAGLADASNTNPGLNGQGEICRSLDTTRPYCNAGYSTDQGQTFVANSTYRTSLAPYYTHVHSQYGINDMTNGQTLAQIQATQAAIFAKFPGKVYSLSTIPPRVTSTDAYLTQANMTASVAGSEATVRAPYNTWVLTKPLGVQNAFDVAKVVEMQDGSQKWKTPEAGITYTLADGVTTAAVTGAMTVDGTHETPYGYGVIQKSNAINGNLIV
jgi:hypothetical protein